MFDILSMCIRYKPKRLFALSYRSVLVNEKEQSLHLHYLEIKIFGADYKAHTILLISKKEAITYRNQTQELIVSLFSYKQ